MDIGSEGMIKEVITKERLNRDKGSELSARKCKCIMQGMATPIICHSSF